MVSVFRDGRYVKKSTGAFVVAALAVGAAGAAYAVDFHLGLQSPRISAPVGAAADYSAGLRMTPLGLSDQQAADRVMSGLRGTAVDSIQVVAPSTGSTGTSLQVNLRNLSASSVEGNWLGSLVRGAVSDLMRSGQSTTQDVVASTHITGVNMEGQASQSDAGVGYVAAGQSFASPSDEALLLRASRVARDFGLTVNSAMVLHPLDSALRVSFTVHTDGPVAWTIDELRAALEGSPRSVEGSYIELYSATGQRLLAESTAYRVGSGGLVFADGQDSRFGAAHG